MIENTLITVYRGGTNVSNWAGGMTLLPALSTVPKAVCLHYSDVRVVPLPISNAHQKESRQYVQVYGKAFVSARGNFSANGD